MLFLAVALPAYGAVVLEYFNAIPSSSAVLLEWSTASEYNVAGFEVSCKLANEPASAYHRIAYFVGKGNAQQGAQYDMLVTQLTPGVPYCFRLKEITTDGEPGETRERCGYGLSMTPTPTSPFVPSAVTTTTVGLTPTVVLFPTGTGLPGQFTPTPTFDPFATPTWTPTFDPFAPTPTWTPTFDPFQSPLATPTWTPTLDPFAPTPTFDPFAPTPTWTPTLDPFAPTPTPTFDPFAPTPTPLGASGSAAALEESGVNAASMAPPMAAAGSAEAPDLDSTLAALADQAPAAQQQPTPDPNAAFATPTPDPFLPQAQSPLAPPTITATVTATVTATITATAALTTPAIITGSLAGPAAGANLAASGALPEQPLPTAAGPTPTSLYVVVTAAPTAAGETLPPLVTPWPTATSAVLPIANLMAPTAQNLTVMLLCFIFIAASGLGVLGLITSLIYMRSRSTRDLDELRLRYRRRLLP